MNSSSSSFILFFIFLMIAHSSSTSLSPIPQQKFDVFLSFSSQDIGKNIASHLHAALSRENINTFKDDLLVRGEEISQPHLQTIEKSKISVIIFSKDYASSSWCLDELLQILECKRKYGQTILPIFYRVHPSDVRHQTGYFAEPFGKHEEHFKDMKGKVESWSAALKEVANLAGWHHSHGSRTESKLVDEIVRDILEKLNYRSSSVGVMERISWRPWMASGPHFFLPFFFAPFYKVL